MSDKISPLVIATRGLPASGKTTWTRDFCEMHPNTIRVNKDSLRLMIYGEPYKQEWEDFVCDIRDEIINFALYKGRNVVVDDTNLREDHIKRIKKIADYHDALFKIQDFTDVPLEVCKERDKQRDDLVGEEVIQSMYDKYLNETS